MDATYINYNKALFVFLLYSQGRSTFYDDV